MDKQRKKKIKKALLLGTTVLVVAALALLPLLTAARSAADDSEASILSAAAARGSIDTQLLGGGQLSSGASVGVKIPEAVKLTEVLVGNGDIVSQGEAIAAVDKVSVMTAITQVQETLDYLSEEIADVSGDTASDTVTALAGGTVKILYAQAGDAVQDVMLEHGSLAVLSLDGLMGVRLSCDTELDVGDTVSLTLSDGTQASGRVKSNRKGVLTVTVADDGYAPGDAVTVSTQAGAALGSGELYVFTPWNTTAYSGAVSRVLAAVGDTVSAGQSLFRLEDAGHTAEYQRLIDQRQEYEALMQELFQLYRSGIVAAPCDGIVTGVEENGAYLLHSAAEASGEAAVSYAQPLAAASDASAEVTLLTSWSGGDDGIRLVMLSGGDEPGAGAPPVSGGDGEGGESAAVSILTPSLSAGVVGQSYAATLQAGDGDNLLIGVWAAAGLPAGLGIDAGTGVISGTPEAAGSFSVTVSFTYNGSPVTKSFPLTVSDGQPAEAAYLGYVAQVIEVAGDTLRVRQTAYSYPITDLGSLPAVRVDTTALTVEKTYTSPLITAGGVTAGAYLFLVAETDGATLRRLAQLELTPGGETGGGMPGGQSGAAPSGGMGQTETFTLYSLETLTIAAVTSQEHMSVSIAVDELDITRIRVGQAAVVSVDALGGEQFAAVISEIANSGESEGGNSKFTVALTLEKSGDMLPGMVSSAFITLDSAVNTLCIPVAALDKQGTETIVYTGLDEKEGTPAQPVPVTIGASDGENVEILSGLSEGQRCYYAYYDTLVESEETRQTGSFSLRSLLRR